MKFIKHLRIVREYVCGGVLVAALFVSVPVHGGEQSSGTITKVDVAQRIVEIGGVRYKLALQSTNYSGDDDSSGAVGISDLKPGQYVIFESDQGIISRIRVSQPM